MVIWAIWNRRNNLCLGKQAVTLRQLLQQAKEWWVQEFSALQEIPAPQRIPIAIAWHPPNASWYKINFDEAFFVKENCAGVGAVIRNEQGLVMASSLKKYLSHSLSLRWKHLQLEGQWNLLQNLVWIRLYWKGTPRCSSTPYNMDVDHWHSLVTKLLICST